MYSLILLGSIILSIGNFVILMAIVIDVIDFLELWWFKVLQMISALNINI